jgi:hypothetical protein
VRSGVSVTFFSITALLQKNRGNYRCSRCNLPKKGHVCPYQPVFKRRDAVPAATRGKKYLTDSPHSQLAHCTVCFRKDVAIQVEMDSEMTLATLGPLQMQGTEGSYSSVQFPEPPAVYFE